MNQEIAPTDRSRRDLTRLLQRLEAKILTKNHDDPEIRRLRHSVFERNKVNGNVENARALLFRLEHDSSQSRGAPTSQKQDERKKDLQDKRNLIKRLQKRLDDLAREGDDGCDDDASDDWSEDEELVNLYAPAIPDLSGGIDTTGPAGPAIRTQDAQMAAAAATMSSTMRNRKAGAVKSLSPDTASATGSHSARAKAAPDSTTPFSPSQTRHSKTGDQASTAQLLESHDNEQVNITDNMVKMVSALKQSTQDFQESINAGNPLVDAAVQVLDKNVTGMEATGKRMSSLRRMTEGVGWWGRLNLYMRVGILWVVAILIGLILPKLRF